MATTRSAPQRRRERPPSAICRWLVAGSCACSGSALADIYFSGTCTWQGVQHVICNPLKARQGCNPPQSAIRPADM
eukprot:7069172-Alexandrium_andersonii.AAC.1